MLCSALIGLDGSDYSSAAVELGIRWAKHHDALLVGLSVIDKPTIEQPEAVPIGGSYFKEQSDEEALHRARNRVEQFLEHFSLRCAEAQVASKVLEDVGVPYEQIVLEAQRYDVILLGQQTYFHFATQEGPCDTVQQVLKNASRPVITVPEKLPAGDRVVIAYDGSLQAARAVQLFAGSGLGRGREIFLVSVSSEPLEAARCVERAAEYLRFHKMDAEKRAITTSDADHDVLLQQIKELDAGLMVMGAYGKSTLGEFFFGSVTQSMLQESVIPLFLYH